MPVSSCSLWAPKACTAECIFDRSDRVDDTRLSATTRELGTCKAFLPPASKRDYHMDLRLLIVSSQPSKGFVFRRRRHAHPRQERPRLVVVSKVCLHRAQLPSLPALHNSHELGYPESTCTRS